MASVEENKAKSIGRQLAVEHNATKEVLADKWQSEYSVCQRANTMAVMFTHPAAIHEGGYSETVKEVIDFALNIKPV